MRNKLTILILILVTSFVSLYSQEGLIHKSFNLPLLTINHPTIKKEINSTVLNDPYYNYESYADAKHLFFIYMSFDNEYKTYLSHVASQPQRIIDGKELGCFYIGEIPFIVKTKCNPDSIFTIGNEKVIFEYNTPQNFTASIEESPSWTFYYTKESFKYLELPDYLIRRLNFQLCE